ncbi:MAG: helix-turn-helix transcriptional regulator [Capsulimonadaceae bacterium]|nr:helix-turn-helix transcriptional regulator [Capsulimonadaceae bacterium]
MYDVPEQAILAFERIHGLRVTVHDLTGSLWAFLAPDRHAHKNPLCGAVKMRDGGFYCSQLEVDELRTELPLFPEGRYHICHAGLVEWVVPVFQETKLAWVLFAGARIPGQTIAGALRMGRWKGSDAPWPSSASLPEQIERAEADDILEHLRQLAARLSQWATELQQERDRHERSRAFAPHFDQEQDRSVLIRRVIAMMHTDHVSLKDLAGKLSLSESRTSHLVKETCGATFQDLLIDARIKTAMGLLRTSSMPVVDVAAYSGFRDIAHFHRIFRRITGLSPGRYRAQRST